MNKAHFLCLLISLLFASCKEEDNKTIVKASGKINTIAVIIDDELWNGEIGDSIRNKFAAPVIGLPQEEPLFTINQYPEKLLEGFMTNGRNILVVKKEPVSKFVVKKNEYATPQNVVHISGRSVSEILSLIEKNSTNVIKLMKQIEIAESQQRIDTSRLDVTRLQKQFDISLKIPTGYAYVLESDNFCWLKKEIISGNTSILIYEVPYKNINIQNNPVDKIIRMRDSIGDLYIHGNASDSKMITEDAYAPYLSQTKLCDLPALETKGTWEMKNDFMSGPFINYVVADEKNNRLIVLEGFCYAPSKEKRDLMHELESIIKTLEFKPRKNEMGN